MLNRPGGAGASFALGPAETDADAETDAETGADAVGPYCVLYSNVLLRAALYDTVRYSCVGCMHSWRTRRCLYQTKIGYAKLDCATILTGLYCNLTVKRRHDGADRAAEVSVDLPALLPDG